MTEEVKVDPVETTEVDVNPLITTKLAYVDNLQQEIQNIQEQIGSLQYQLDIRVTALTAYQSTLEVKEEEPKANGKDLTK
jgi:replicative DNA helicase